MMKNITHFNFLHEIYTPVCEAAVNHTITQIGITITSCKAKYSHLVNSRDGYMEANCLLSVLVNVLRKFQS